MPSRGIFCSSCPFREVRSISVSMIPSDRIPQNFKVFVKCITPVSVTPKFSGDCEVLDGGDENLELPFRDNWEAMKHPGSDEHVVYTRGAEQEKWWAVIPYQSQVEHGFQPSNADRSEYMMLFQRSALDLVPLATPKWILSAFSMTSLDIQLRCSKHLVASVSKIGALFGLSVTPLALCCWTGFRSPGVRELTAKDFV